VENFIEHVAMRIHMKILKKLLALIILIIFVGLTLSHITGFFQIQLSIPMEWITAILSIIDLGVVVAIIKLWREKPKLSIEYNKKNQDVFFPEYIIGQDEKSQNIIRRDIQVRIENKGGVARKCKAYLQLIKSYKSTIVPSKEEKHLIWARNNSEEIDIDAKKGRELLHIVFSDSYLKKKGGGYCAFISTKSAFKTPFNRAQEGFGTGDFEVELIVISEEGSSSKAQFRLHVDKDFRKLSMEKIS